MNLPELQLSIKAKKIPHFLIFVGNEYALINEYISRIEKNLNLKKYSVSTACSVLTPSKVMTLTKDVRLYVSKYESQIQISEKSWEYVRNLGYNYLIIVLTTIDKRSKFYKQFEDIIIPFEAQSKTVVKNMLNGKISLPEKLMDRLLVGCAYNYGRCCLEIQKIKSISEEEHCSEEEAYKKLLDCGIIYEEPTTQIQEFIKYVMLGDYKCFDILDILKRNNESSFVLIAWLYTNIRNQLIVQTIKKVSSDTTGLNYYAIKECQNRLNYYSTEELKQALRTIKKVEQGLKTGVYTESNAIDYILINIL